MFSCTNNIVEIHNKYEHNFSVVTYCLDIYPAFLLSVLLCGLPEHRYLLSDKLYISLFINARSALLYWNRWTVWVLNYQIIVWPIHIRLSGTVRPQLFAEFLVDHLPQQAVMFLFVFLLRQLIVFAYFIRIYYFAVFFSIKNSFS